MRKLKIAPEVREQIINRIKNEGVSVAQAAKEHGVSDASIYNWIGAKVDEHVAASGLLGRVMARLRGH